MYQRALAAGAESFVRAERHGLRRPRRGVTDPNGHQWFMATHKAGDRFIPEGLHTVTPGMRVKGAAQFLIFVQKALTRLWNAATRRESGDRER